MKISTFVTVYHPAAPQFLPFCG